MHPILHCYATQFCQFVKCTSLPGQLRDMICDYPNLQRLVFAAVPYRDVLYCVALYFRRTVMKFMAKLVSHFSSMGLGDWLKF